MDRAGGLRAAMTGAVMGSGIEADHGERGRGDNEAEEVREFAVHGGGVMVGKGPRAHQTLL